MSSLLGSRNFLLELGKPLTQPLFAATYCRQRLF
jgi:hypothetical protein